MTTGPASIVRVYTHPACLAHDTGPAHAERPERLSAVTQALRDAFDGSLDWHEAPRATHEQLLRAHDPELLRVVLETAPAQSLMLDPDTVLSPGSAEAALRAAGAAIAAENRPPMKSLVMLGKIQARVVRNLEEGFAVAMERFVLGIRTVQQA